jgi:aryl-alcohol dehydrogenase
LGEDATVEILAAVTRKKGASFRLEILELAEPKETEVLVKMAGCGVCHTDISARDQGLPVPLPAVLGHEGSGIVEKVGSAVKNIMPGDHVVFSSYSCEECEACLSGHPSQCVRCDEVDFFGRYADGTKRLRDENGEEISSFFSQSSFATWCVADRNNTVVVDRDLDIAMLGPLGCGLGTGAGSVLNVLKPAPGDSIAVFGCGSVGLSAIMAAKLSGCSTIIGVDIVASRLSMAKELGATHVISGKAIGNISGAIKDITSGRGVDCSLDTTAIEELINEALYCLRRGGSAGVVGSTGEKIIGIKLQYALMGESKRLIGIVQGDAVPKLFIPKLIRLYKDGVYPFDKLIQYFEFDKINEAFEATEKGGAIKPVIKY